MSLNQLHRSLPNSSVSNCKYQTRRVFEQTTHINRLRGATIRVCVGLDSASCTGTTGAECECKSCWYLPQALLSHHSRFFKAACSCDFREKEKNRIELPSDSHAVFALFVEWMYYGYYTLPTPKFFAPAVPSEPGNMHARCAVLGDKILSNNFKNYAMRRLYEQHSDSAPIPGTLTTEDAVYVLNNTAVGSKLRQLYVDYITQHFTTPKRLAGSTEEWDGILLKYPDARSFILQSFRTPTENRKYVKSKEAYLD